MKHGVMDIKKLLLIASLGMVVWACKMYYPTEKIEYKAQADDAQVREGKRLTMLMCGPCHYNAATKDFSGKKMDDSPAFLGKIYAANITQHNEKGIGTYTAGELAYLIKTGISRSGKNMPYMHRPNIAEADLQAIIAYLKSNDAAVQPSERTSGVTRYSPLGKLGISLSKPGAYSDKEIVKPVDDPLLLGKYLVDNLACYHCHSKSFTALDIYHPEKSKGYMGGGNKLKDGHGKTVKSPNLTPHATGIQDWSEAEFKSAITRGIGKNNAIIAYPMPLYPELTDDEVSALYAYLKSISPVNNAVRR